MTTVYEPCHKKAFGFSDQIRHKSGERLEISDLGREIVPSMQTPGFLMTWLIYFKCLVKRTLWKNKGG